MVRVEKLMGRELLQGPLVPFIPLIVAAVGAGAAVYQVKKSEDAAESAANANAMKSREAQSLSEAKANAQRSRDTQQSQIQEMANADAELAQAGTMENLASQEKTRIEQEKLLAGNREQAEYASKFEPGQGGNGDDSASDFLVPKISEDASLSRTAGDTGGGGLVTPLGFNV